MVAADTIGGVDAVCVQVLRNQGLPVDAEALPCGEPDRPTREDCKLVLTICRRTLYKRSLQGLTKSQKSKYPWTQRKIDADARLKAYKAEEKLELVSAILADKKADLTYSGIR